MEVFRELPSLPASLPQWQRHAGGQQIVGAKAVFMDVGQFVWESIRHNRGDIAFMLAQPSDQRLDGRGFLAKSINIEAGENVHCDQSLSRSSLWLPVGPWRLPLPLALCWAGVSQDRQEPTALMQCIRHVVHRQDCHCVATARCLAMTWLA